MIDFVLTPDPYESIPSLLTSRGEFSNSPEFLSLVGHGDRLPGVVAAAYARYVARHATTGTERDLVTLVEPLNTIAAWGDLKSDTLLRDEVLSQFRADGALRVLLPLFSGRLHTLLG